MFTFLGNIRNIGQIKSGVSKSGKDWEKLDFVLANDISHESICMTLFGRKKVDYFTQTFNVGQSVEVSFTIEAREYNGKFYNNISALNVVDPASRDSSKQRKAPAQSSEPQQGDLPF